MKSKVKTKVFLPAITMAMIGVTSVVTAFAYTPPMIVSGTDYSGIETITFIPVPPEELLAETFPYDYFFTDQDGTIYPIEKESCTRRGCTHQFTTAGISTKHTKNSNGSCVVKYIESMRCKLCGTIKDNSMINEVQYAKCPH